jgi:hypothetical protein
VDTRRKVIKKSIDFGGRKPFSEKLCGNIYFQLKECFFVEKIENKK